VGIIVPSGVATDDTTKFFFQDLMESQSLVTLYDFENRERLFPAVDSRMKFSLVTLAGHDRPVTAGAEFVFFARNLNDLTSEEHRYRLASADISVVNPNTLTCPTFRTRRDAQLSLQVHRRIPVFDLQNADVREYPWKCETERGFRQGEDEETLNRLGFTGEKLLFTSEEIEDHAEFLPVFEGKTFDIYDHRFASIKLSASALYRPRQPIATSLAQHKEPSFSVSPYFWVKREVARAKFPWDWLVAFKKVTSSTNERTMVATVLPACAVNDTVHFFSPGDSSLVHLLPVLCANLCSFVLDFLGRQKVGGNAYSMFITRQLPILPPWAYAERYTKFISPRVLELIYTAWDLQPFAQDCGYHGPPFRWDEERRFLLRCELDAAYFHLYSIARDDVDYIMDTFPIVKRRDEAAHDEYRTKRVILEIYDAMQQAIETGLPYQTLLDPPPADPRVAHPARNESDVLTRMEG